MNPLLDLAMIPAAVLVCAIVAVGLAHCMLRGFELLARRSRK